MPDRRVLVLGGNGFIGSHVVDQLVADGNDVTVFDRFGVAQPRFTASGVRMIDGDFLNAEDVTNAVDGIGTVVHLVSTTNPLTAEADPLLDINTNLMGSVALFEACAASSSVQRIVFASSGGTVYGNGSGILSEDSLTQPISPYGICKLATENYLRFFAATTKLTSVSLRIANPYGDRQPLGRNQGVIPIFIERLLKGMPLTVFGDGTMVRDYLYVTDVAVAISRAVSCAEPHASVYNIGSGVGHSVNDIVCAIEKALGRTAQIEHREQPRSFAQSVVLDTRRFTDEFGWRPTVSLDEGVAMTVGYLRNQLGL